LPSVIEQCTQALQQGHFAVARDLARGALAAAEAPAARLPLLLELLAQAQAGVQDHAAAAQTWQQAYEAAATATDRARLFERACHAYHQRRDATALLRLAQAQLLHACSAQERAACWLVAGEALIQLRQYRDARQRYLAPAVDLVGVAPETRMGLWHNLGRCYLAEHAFAAAAEAFRRAAGLVDVLRLDPHTPRPSALHAHLHDLRNTEHFYDGLIHLIYHRPQQALHAWQALQPPITARVALHAALFQALAYRQLQQPEAAERAAQALARSPALPDTLRGPYAVVCAGIANLRQATAAVGAHLEAALDAVLVPCTFWEPDWRALLYQELGLALWRVGFRQAAIACYEDGLKAVLHRARIWDDPHRSDWLRGPSLLAALENLPLHTWSAVIQGEVLRLLHGLAWLYGPAQDDTLAETALALALRLATTPEQQAHLWLHRGWLAATTACQQDAAPRRAEILLGVQQARAHCADAPLAQVLRGVEALLQGDETLALTCFGQVPAVPEVPAVQALCVAVWLWAQARQGTLEHALRRAQETPWQTETTLTSALELLLAWTTRVAAPATEAMVAWLAPLLAQQGLHTLLALHRLCRPGVLPEAQWAALRTGLAALLTHPTHAVLADQVAEILGGSALLERIDTLLAQLDQYAAPTLPHHHSPRQKPRHHRRAPAPDHGAPDAAGVLHLIGLLERAHSAAVDPPMPAVIQRWLVRYPHLGTRAPEVVGALLGLLRQCPAAHATMRFILAYVPLSRRQRQALETALQTPSPATTPTRDPLAWEPLQSWPLPRLLDTLADVRQQPAAPPGEATEARAWYALAVVLARVGLPARAVDALHACLRLYPEQPLAHFMLAQLLHVQHLYQAAWQHIQQAWHALLAQAPQPQVLHLELLNHLLVLLGNTRQYDRFPEWFATFERLRAELETAALSDAQQQRVREEEGEYALSRALYLAAAPSITQTPEILEQQLDCLVQAIAKGTPSTQHAALHRQAETLAHLQRLNDAAATYARVVQQWPDDRRARLALTLLTAMRQATADVAAADQALAEALSLAFADTGDTPSPLTLQAALAWLHQASRRDPRYAEVTDVLTVSGGIAMQQGEVTLALEVLLPLYALVAQPRQAYYLAAAYYARGQQAAALADQLQDCTRALQYAQHALTSVPHRQRTSALVQEIQAFHHRLTAARQHEVVMMDYRTRVCRLFSRYGVPFQEEVVDQAPDAPWLELHELVDLDEASGDPVVTVRLCFNANATGSRPEPSESEVALYAQHQREVQRLVAAHGIAALPWPSIAYAGDTAFARIFPERLALNCDLVCLAYADRGALLRYARVLQQTSRTLATLAAAAPPPSVSRLTAAARRVTVMPLLRQRLRTLATAIASKALRRQIETLREEVLPPSLLERLQTFPAFADAAAYFDAIAEALRPLLEVPPAASPRLPEAADVPARLERRRQRRATTRRHNDWPRDALSAASQAPPVGT
jgi:hypothetical protein